MHRIQKSCFILRLETVFEQALILQFIIFSTLEFKLNISISLIVIEILADSLPHQSPKQTQKHTV